MAGWAPGWAPAGCACTPGSRRGAVPGRSAARLPLPAAGPASARGVGRVARGRARGGGLAGSRRLPSPRRGAFNSVRAGPRSVYARLPESGGIVPSQSASSPSTEPPSPRRRLGGRTAVRGSGGLGGGRGRLGLC